MDKFSSYHKHVNIRLRKMLTFKNYQTLGVTQFIMFCDIIQNTDQWQTEWPLLAMADGIATFYVGRYYAKVWQREWPLWHML